MSRFENILFALLPLMAFSVPSAKCQYHGGNEDGVDMGITIGSDLSGKISRVSIIYFGSFDEGSAYISSSAIISGEKIDIYSGGNDEGSFHNHNTHSLSGGNLSALYSGSTEEGSAFAFASLSPSGISSASIYAGGFDDGHALKPWSNLLKGQFPLSMYHGGMDEGHTANAGSGVVASPGIQIYSGSSDEGSEQVKYTGPLDLSAQNLLFRGGEDDGFTLIIQYGLYLSGGSTPVEKDIVNEITLYPNPLSGNELFIRFETGLTDRDIEVLTLHSLNGIQHPVSYSSAGGSIQISMQKRLQSGTYILRVLTTRGENYTIRFIASQ